MTTANQLRVFVTGGTGLIGSFLVEELLGRGAEVSLLVRPGSMASRHARIARLEALAARHGARLTVVRGDITVAGLGLSAEGRAVLAGSAHCFHVAALYDLEADDAALTEANVAGTERLIGLLREVAFAGTLHHVSSIAVAGSFRGTFTEAMFDEGQSLPHAYHRTKFLAEKLVRGSGLRHRIYRPSAVVGHSQTGEMDRIDGPYYGFRSMELLARMVPRWLPLPMPKIRGAMNLVPVDYVAKAMAHLALRPESDATVYHLVDPKPARFNDMVATFLRAMRGPNVGPVVNLSLIPGLGNVVDMAFGLPAVKEIGREVLEDLGYPVGAFGALNLQVRFDARETEKGLAGSGVECPRLAQYAKALVRYYEDHLDISHQRAARYAKYFHGKTVLVTGASRGIGAATARQAAAAGARLLLVARDAPSLDRLVSDIRERGGEAHALPTDLSRFSAIDELIAKVDTEFGGVDVLVHNAARSIRRPIAESLDRFHDFERIMALNYFAPVRLTLGLLPGMRKRRGRIANILTMGVLVPGPYFSAYLASKKALEGFGDSLSAEFHGEGVDVTQVYMPLVKTEMMAPTKEYAGRTDMLSPEQAAQMVLDGIVDRQRRVTPPFGSIVALANLFIPRATTRVLNILRRTFPTGGAASEFPLERSLIKKFLGGSPI